MNKVELIIGSDENPVTIVRDGLLPVGSEELHPMHLVIDKFLTDVRILQTSYLLVMPHALTWLKDKYQENIDTLTKFTPEEIDGDEESHTFTTESAHQAAEIYGALREIESLRGLKLVETLSRSLFTQLFSEYDCFTGALMKVVYGRKVELLKGITRQISFAELLAFDNLESVRLDLLEKEIDSFRRDSYVEQFCSLEKKFNITLRDFPEWSEFVEISQRRNLVVHNGGIVSEQYLIVCERENYKFDKKPKVGEELPADADYFYRACIVISKVAYMLTHTLWRKVFPDERKFANDAADSIIYQLLSEKRWPTAFEVAVFSLNDQMRKGLEERDLRLRTINAAIAAKFCNKTEKCIAILRTLDWSATYRDFHLALAVLNDEFEIASDMMRKIGKSGELVGELAYHEWPLFHKFRETTQFLAAYDEIYGVSFIARSVRQSSEAAKSMNEEIDVSDDKPKIIQERKTKQRAGNETSLPRRPAKPKKTTKL